MNPELEFSRPVPARLWVFAGLGALAIHAACVALAVAHLRADEEEALGAPAIAIGVELMAPRAEPSDLPPGPEADASAASPAVPEHKAVTEQSERPRDIPTETEDPDRIVTQNDNKPKQDEPVVAVQAAPSEPSIAAEATAAPSLAAVPEAPRSAAPAPGIGESAALIRLSWHKELSAHFDRHKRYPADRANKAAEIVVSFVLDRTGHILSSRIVRGSGDASFDNAALAMLQRSDPVPPPPPLVADEGLSFTLPVVFRVKGRK
jgi:periplasmic protein TonB